MTNKLHKVCDWVGDGNRYVVVGTYVEPYTKEEFLTLVNAYMDDETFIWQPCMTYPTTIALEKELIFYEPN